LRIQDILESISAVAEYTAGLTYGDFCARRMVVDAVLRNVEIIGEAAASVPDDLKARHPQVAWRDIRNTRNVLAHVYFGVDLKRVWEVVQRDLPRLEQQLAQMLADEGET
jgi:uncharacterized protein with HEPN domain